MDEPRFRTIQEAQQSMADALRAPFDRQMQGRPPRGPQHEWTPEEAATEAARQQAMLTTQRKGIFPFDWQRAGLVPGFGYSWQGRGQLRNPFW